MVSFVESCIICELDWEFPPAKGCFSTQDWRGLWLVFFHLTVFFFTAGLQLLDFDITARDSSRTILNFWSTQNSPAQLLGLSSINADMLLPKSSSWTQYYIKWPVWSTLLYVWWHLKDGSMRACTVSKDAIVISTMDGSWSGVGIRGQTCKPCRLRFH
jgi:hypothetical protein